MPKKPVLWGEQDDEQIKATHRDPRLREGGFDPFYIPGYTEHRQANSIAEGHEGVLPEHVKRKYYKRFETGPGEMRYVFAWVRATSPSGAQSYNADVDATLYAQKGFRPVQVESKQDFMDKFGCGWPPAATLVDGKVRQLDLALWVIDGAQARFNEEEQKRYNEWFHGTNQPKEGKATHLPFDIIDFEEDEHAKSAVDDLPDAFVAGPATNYNNQ